MANAYSLSDLIEFLDHAGDRGLMPAATAQALAVASRNVLGVLTESEKEDLSQLAVETIVKRFYNKRAMDFSPSSLREYERRVKRAIDLFERWRHDPGNFSVKTRATISSRRKARGHEFREEAAESQPDSSEALGPPRAGTYHSSIPVRPGVVVTLANVPGDLTMAEAERLATFVRMLVVHS